MRWHPAEAGTRLKREPGSGLVIMGSGVLIQTLTRSGLIDEYVLIVHPLVLDTGTPSVPPGSPPTALRLLASRPTATGALILTYRSQTGGAS